MPYCLTDIKIEVLSFWKSLPHAGEKWFHLGQNFIFYHCKQKVLFWCGGRVCFQSCGSCWCCWSWHIPLSWMGTFSCQTWWWIIGVVWVFFFLSVKMYSCQHSVGPSLITPRLVVLWSTLFVPFSAKPHVTVYSLACGGVSRSTPTCYPGCGSETQ